MSHSTPRSRNSFSLDSTTFVHASEPDELPRKPWYHYLPLLGTVSLILAPQPSLLIVLAPFTFIVHLSAIYTLTFMIFTSLIICVARDPGWRASGADRGALCDFDFSAPGKWCRKCWAPKPERTHHCTHCGRCVLKMGASIRTLILGAQLNYF
ncbi:hypothetical protein CPB85DRAFT_1331597 [Mucidula mucida]|nr:hypothetical protein CPB85DRAFT_1331597 [Mucidula mucida]